MKSYLAMMDAGNYTAPTPLYVASGLLTYLNASGADRLSPLAPCPALGSA